MSNENIIYNPYFGTNLCNLLANSIVEKIKLIDPKHYVDISVTNVNQFLIVFGKTSLEERLNLTEIFESFMETIPEPMRILVKVFDMVEYGKEREKTTILYNHFFTKYKSNYHENFTDYKKLLEWNKQGLFANLRHFGTTQYINVVSNENELEIPKEYTELLISKRTYKSEPIYGKDIRSEKYLYILSRYIAHNLFEKNLCKTLDIHISTDSDMNNISWENVNLTIDSESLITTKKWVESLVLDIFDFEPEKLISHLNLDNYDFANEILVVNENYPWKNRDRVKEIILI